MAGFGRAFRALALLVMAFVAAYTHEAHACGVFYRVVSIGVDKYTPYLAVERVLLAWDETTQTEDFVREARFDRSNQAFGFSVPVPTLPEVSAVPDAPFGGLSRAFPFVIPNSSSALDIRSGGAAGGGGDDSDDPVPAPVVLSEQRVGHFTAFVLAATDTQGLGVWLKNNGLSETAEGSDWLAHYVRLGFYYVALRYDAAADASPGMTSETVRIRFRTPVPYYPYREPLSERPAHRPRDLQVWFMSQREHVPVASVMKGVAPVWKRPWQSGVSVSPGAQYARSVLGSLADIVPSDASTWIVSSFRDGKANRESWGDVLLVPRAPSAVDDAAIAERWPLLAALDPLLEGNLEPAPMTTEALSLPDVPHLVPLPPRVVVATPASSTSASAARDALVASAAASPLPAPTTSAAHASERHGGCSFVGDDANAASELEVGAFSLLVGVGAFVRRRRALLVAVSAAAMLASIGCKQAAPRENGGSGTPAETSSDASQGAATTASSAFVATAPVLQIADANELREREKSALRVLFGRTIAARLPLDAQLRVTEEVERYDPSSPALSLAQPKPWIAGHATVGHATSGTPIPDADHVLTSVQRRFLLCYELDLQSNPTLAGAVTMQAQVSPNGEVDFASAVGSTDISDAVVRCLAGKIRNLTFSPTTSGTKLQFQLTFQPAKPSAQ